ncbi:MAG: transketolase [Clostridiales Family XIII bacterium]|jgi:transketolase|nr:transketolase [Clostridiales Family XIII bacterium]
MDTNPAVNAIRILAADQVQKANSGHPGFPLGAAPIVYELYAHHIRHNPKDPAWFGRDRFVLSGGHGSAMMYALLHLYGYEGLTVDELKRFRQLGSKTPGHPEWGVTPGIDASTGPLGAGLGMAVGMAMAEAHLAKLFNRPGLPLVDHYTYVLAGDGCLMEGISSEACSLAGTLGLSKLIVLYDSNRITIEGSTDLAFTEDVSARFEAFGFQTLEVADGNEIEQIRFALELAKQDKTRPSFIKIHTHIGYGVPAKQDTASAHGEPLGEENEKILRENLKWPLAEAFAVPDEVYAHYRGLAEKGAAAEHAWVELLGAYKEADPEAYESFEKTLSMELPAAVKTYLGKAEKQEKPDATRSVSGAILNALKDDLPWLFGGSADLAPSNKSALSGAGDFSKQTPEGRNVHFGVRELAMGAIVNGLALHGGVLPYAATFFVFSEYMKPMMRLAAIMGLPVFYVLTHDSIGVGEDGPTHEPIEQLAMLRAQPGIDVFRPADVNETKAAYLSALTAKGPTALVLSRQNIAPVCENPKDALKGGYVVAAEDGKKPDVILLASGSEVPLCIEAKALLKKKKIDARVVSMPCMEAFERQSAKYRESVLPPQVAARVAVEAGSRQPWGFYVGPAGAAVTMDGFGESAPAAELFKKFGFTAENVAKVAEKAVKEQK